MDLQHHIDGLKQLSQDLIETGVDEQGRLKTKTSETLGRVHFLIHELEAISKAVA